MTNRPLARCIRWRHPHFWMALGLGLAPIAPGLALESAPTLAAVAGRSPLAQRRQPPNERETRQRDARCAPIPPLPERRDRRELSVGDAGPDVVELKALLTLLGFYDGDLGGDRFEDPLSLAVQAFQQAVDVPVDGRVSLATWRVLLPVADPSAAPCNLPPDVAIAPGNPPESFPNATGAPGTGTPGEQPAIARRSPPSDVARDRPNTAPPNTATPNTATPNTAPNRDPSAVPPLTDAPTDEFSADFTGLPAPSGGWSETREPQNSPPPSSLADPALAPSVGTPSTGGWVTDADGNATGSAADLGTPSASVRATSGNADGPPPAISTPTTDPTLGWEQEDLPPSGSPIGSTPDSSETWPEPPPPITDDWTGGLTPNAGPAQTAAAPADLAAVPETTIPETTPSWDRPTLRQGDSGEAVRQLQALLRDRGFLQGNLDGAFGPATDAAVRSAQQRYNLTVDGIVGPATWERLTQGS